MASRQKITPFWKFVSDLSEITAYPKREIKNTNTCQENWKLFKCVYKSLLKLDKFKRVNLVEKYIRDENDYDIKRKLVLGINQELSRGPSKAEKEYLNYLEIYGNNSYVEEEIDFFNDFYNSNEHCY